MESLKIVVSNPFFYPFEGGIEHRMHKLCRVLADWMSITNPESEANWQRKFTTLREKIRTALVSRTKMIRRKLSPF